MNSVRLESARSPRARATGRVRDGYNGKAATVQPDPLDANELDYAAHERLAARIAAIQAQRLDELSLIGHPTSFDPETRSVVETALRLAARGVLES